MILSILSFLFRKTGILPMVAVAIAFTFTSAGYSANPDTTWSVFLRVNMSKAVNDHIFKPDSDYVYVVMDHGMEPMRLVPEPGDIYSGTLFDLLDSGTTYLFRFRINDSVFESVNRSITAQPGMVNYNAWWNNAPLSVTTFVVNMKYAVQDGKFDPANDSVCMVGTMNNMEGSPRMKRIDTTLNYSLLDTLSYPGTVYHYKYRINADSAGLELINQPDRVIRIPDTLTTAASDFNNFNPAKRLMTFRCNMSYYIEANHFEPMGEYLDIAGNFNGYGANDILFDTDGDSVYSLDLYLDTAWISQGPLSFRFRINGNQEQAELPGKPGRLYNFHDTINQNVNIYSCYYNDLNPAIPMPPWASNVDIQGQLIYRKFLSGSYSYENVNGIPEGTSSYRWLRSDNAEGNNAIPIDSALTITYIIDTLDVGKWLVFEVTPKAISGDSAVGKPMRAVSAASISRWDVGVPENAGMIARVFPNPASDYLNIVSRQEADRIEIFNLFGQLVLVRTNIHARDSRLQLGSLPGGMYILKVTAQSGASGAFRIIKQ